MKKTFILLTCTAFLLSSCEGLRRAPRSQVNQEPGDREVKSRKIDADGRIVRPEPIKFKPKLRAPLLGNEDGAAFDAKYHNIICEDCWEEIKKFDNEELAQPSNIKEEKETSKPWYTKVLSWWPMLLVICIVYTILARRG